MKTIIIYFTEDKKNFQVIRPTSKFKGQVSELVHQITKSNLEKGFGYQKNYHSFEIINY